jgi:hypothetical protein
MFAFSAAAVGGLKNMQNGGKKTRRGLDAWDRVRVHLLPMSMATTNGFAAKYNTSAMTSCSYTKYDTVMERDRRLTGFVRGQTDKPEAPPGFELNNPWRVCYTQCSSS